MAQIRGLSPNEIAVALISNFGPEREAPINIDHLRSLYGFFRQRPIVGGAEHFAPSGTPPLGQNTDTSNSELSHATTPSA
jgi:hypothetical protein